ncbi:hypothetical protein AG4045_022707 [Apium graveolens]|uniref:Gnk2-homologous domain-containing protein n=1 Tax=Apium graveolens TaxID=4045 RepID=A0A6L5B9V2_APIGR|nr:hypothetical protein AG4045_022707 [Apium graveolens]
MIIGTSGGSSVFVLCLICLVAVAQSGLYNTACGRDSRVNYTSNSIYKTNLDTAQATLFAAANTSTSGFYNATVGEGPDQVNALVYCRDDVQPDICRSCVKDSMNKLRESCPTTKEADIWYDECVLRYSNASIFNNVETWPLVFIWIQRNASDMDQFNKDLRDLLDKLKGQAIQQKFASGDTRSLDFLTIYGLMQCSPDLSSIQCNNCLDGLMGSIQSCCSGKLGARIINPSCQLRFTTNDLFYNDTIVDAPTPLRQLPATPPSVPPPVDGRDDKNRRTVIVVVAVLVGLVLMLLVLAWKNWKEGAPSNVVDPSSSTHEVALPTNTVISRVSNKSSNIKTIALDRTSKYSRRKENNYSKTRTELEKQTTPKHTQEQRTTTKN